MDDLIPLASAAGAEPAVTTGTGGTGLAASVIVAHPGRQHSYQTALAFQEAGLLKWYLTGFYYKPTSWWARALNVAPRFVRDPLRREFHRRNLLELDDHKVQLAPVRELMQVGFTRLMPQARFDMISKRNRQFEKWVGQVVAGERPAAVFCYNTSALESFSAAKSIGALRVLDQTISDLRFGFEILQDEAQAHPEFADSMPLTQIKENIDRNSEELERADIVVVGSEFAKHSLIEHRVCADKIVTISYGANLPKFAVSGRRSGVFRVIFVGQISQRKGIKYLLEAVKRLALPNLEVVLVGAVLGSGAGLAPYRDCFRLVGNVPHGEVPRYLADSNVFVYPSLYEGSAIAVYEALASGLPVITTPNTGSIVREGVEGYVVPIRDVGAIEEKLLLLYENPDRCAELGRNARRRAEQFTWRHYRERLAGLALEALR